MNVVLMITGETLKDQIFSPVAEKALQRGRLSGEQQKGLDEPE